MYRQCIVNQFENKVFDCSQGGIIRFGAACEACGQIKRSRAVYFSLWDQPPENMNKKEIRDALWEWESGCERDLAVEELRRQFNYCKICKRFICNHCLRICDDTDMCVDCAARLNETGTTIIED